VNAEERLTERQKEFVLNVLGLTEEEFFWRKEHDYDQLMDDCADIEIEETIKAGDNDLSPRGVMAVEMVDFVHGPYSEDD
jgi:hypothetical protein